MPGSGRNDEQGQQPDEQRAFLSDVSLFVPDVNEHEYPFALTLFSYVAQNRFRRNLGEPAAGERNRANQNLKLYANNAIPTAIQISMS